MQALLAFLIELTDQPYTRSASALWREKLVGSTHDERCSSIQNQLELAFAHRASTEPIKSALHKFLDSTEAMKMAFEENSKLRENGNKAAHLNLTKPQFLAVVDEHSKQGGVGVGALQVFVEFLFSNSP